MAIVLLRMAGRRTFQEVTTNYMSDNVMFSMGKRLCVLIQITVPLEERIHEAYERKLANFDYMVEECRASWWRTLCFP